MAKLKEIAPMVLAGLAGAASPQGADVFQDIHRQRMIAEQQKRREAESEQRQSLALKAAERAERGEERDIERHQGVVKLSELRLQEAERERDEADDDRRGLEKYIQSNIEANQDMFSQEPGNLIMFQEAKSIKEADKMLDEWNAPSIKEIAEKHKEAAQSGMRIQTDRYGNISQAWAAEDDRDSGKTLHKANQTIVKALGKNRELQADMEEAKQDYGNALRVLKSGVSSEDESGVKRYEDANEEVKEASDRMRQIRAQMERQSLDLHGDIMYITGSEQAAMQAMGMLGNGGGGQAQQQTGEQERPPDAPPVTDEYDALYNEKN
jgi:hypothetical protein